MVRLVGAVGRGFGAVLAELGGITLFVIKSSE
jgi:hypothetical protein